MAKLKNFIDKVKRTDSSVDVLKLEAVYDFIMNLSDSEPDLSVAEEVLRLKPDLSSVVVAMFYPVIEKIDYESKKVIDLVDPDSIKLLSYVKRLKGISYNVEVTDPETIRAMFIAMAKDLRVILIMLCSMVVISSKLGELDKTECDKFAFRAMNIFVPIAARLGIYEIKHRLEDNSFKYINPEQCNIISDQLKKFGQKKAGYIKEIKDVLTEFLKENNIDGFVDGRIKSTYSIYRKMKLKNKLSIDDLFDIVAMRIVLPTQYSGDIETVEHLYRVLGLIHGKWTPMQNRFKDYIAVPKPNGYQSLHTTVLGIAPDFSEQPVEIQIRSERMHREAELGIATHWIYEEKGSHYRVDSAKSNPAQKNRLAWLTGLKDVKAFEGIFDGTDIIDAFEDRIFALTPKGDVKDLPVGSTVIDFAYAIHTDIGHRASMAKTNGVSVPLSYEIKNGDVIEIVLKPKPAPKVEWLGFVKTDGARSRIKSWVKGQHNDYNFKNGREIINKYLERSGMSTLDDGFSMLKVYDGRLLSLAQRKKLVEDVGNGAILIKNFIKKLFPQNAVLKNVIVSKISIAKKLKSIKKPASDNQVFIGGESGLPIKFAKCCSPKRGDEIAGYVTTYGHITVHKINCKFWKNSISKRKVDASWSLPDASKDKKYTVKIVVEVKNRIGLLRDIAAAIAGMNINIVDVVFVERKEDFVKRVFILEFSDYSQVDALMDKLENISDVMKVYVQPSSKM
ncbi:MAG: (p)ppGpp synthetase I SpoT/RelA, GTP pyrophosphokinase [Candidatus Peregrinibacteria bacterium GW2011_GWC2_39_14]|nr:MAG: (p)ppGpp synthetase I SpoT/RelA, GTP pyrophosphokinase [Candidatus Peregrinibacteria bacterium GW2011_GWC2_39_14]